MCQHAEYVIKFSFSLSPRCKRLIGRSTISIICHLAVVQFMKKRNKTTTENALGAFVPFLRFKSGKPDFSPSRSEWGSDSRRALEHNENSISEAAAAVQRGSDSNRCELLDSGSAHLHEARPRRGDSRHFKLAAAASALGARGRASPRQRATQTSRLK